MLDTNRLTLIRKAGAQPSEVASAAELYKAFWGFVGRRYQVIVFFLLLALALGATYLYTSPPRYTARAVLLIDTTKTQILGAQSPFSDVPMDSETVDTQIEILKSENIATSVIKDLHLTEDPEFTSPYPGFIGTILNFVTRISMNFVTRISTSTSPTVLGLSSEDQLMRGAVAAFGRNLTVKRVGFTYAIEIDFQSLSPDRAAQIANAVADAYVVNTLEAKYQTTRRAGDWLQDRLKELRQQATDAERAVNDFKQKNNIVVSDGHRLNEQQLAELNSALIQAQAKTAEAKARLDRVQQILSHDKEDPLDGAAGTVTDTLHNDVITKLRQQYLEYAAKESDWSRRLGPQHLAVVNLRNQMQEVQHNIRDELSRIAETYKSDYEIAKAREDSVQKSLANIVTQSQTVDNAQITLTDLQSSAQTYRALYDNFLQRYMASVQQQSFPVTDARLMTSATRPSGKSAPNTNLVFALASLGGLIFGVGIGFLREISDRGVRSTSQIREQLNVDCLAVVPIVKGVGKQAPVSTVSRAALLDDRIISLEKSIFRTVLDSPFSAFTESIRSLKVAIDHSRITKSNQLIAITSSLPNEGKSTIAAALAQIIAHSGSRCLLVDCDLRNPSLSRKLSPGASSGLLEVVSGKAMLEDVVWSDPTTGLSFLPAVTGSRLTNSSSILASKATKKAFEELRKPYDFVIVDLSPLEPVVDARAAGHLFDSFLFVVEWGRTEIDVAEHALGTARGLHEILLGVVLNKADMTRLGRYESYGGRHYHYGYATNYGNSD